MASGDPTPDEEPTAAAEEAEDAQAEDGKTAESTSRTEAGEASGEDDEHAGAGDEDEPADGDGDEDGDGPKARTPRRPLPRGVKVLAGVAVVAALAGGGFQAVSAHLRAREPIANKALVDTTATTQVVGDVTAGLNAILSYSYNDTSAPRQAARRILVGAAARQYQQLISVVRQQAPKQRIVLRSNVITASPVSLGDDRAELLVFLDQSTRKGRGAKTSNAAAQLLITARHQEDRWVISNIALR